jgi:dihydrolipoamide dehydrogenase
LSKIPKTMVVIGAGVIGLEMGSVYARLGAQVTVVEYLDQITPGMDAEVQKTFKRILEKQGLTFIMGAAVKGVETAKGKAKVTYALRKDDSEHTLDADTVLVATGRKPFTDGPRPQRPRHQHVPAGTGRDRRPLAHQCPRHLGHRRLHRRPHARPQGRGRGHGRGRDHRGPGGPRELRRDPRRDLHPPRGRDSVGLTEEQLKAEGRAYKAGKFSFMGNGRAKANFAADGFVKILADKDTDRILGAHIIGPMAGDLIHEICVAMEFGAAAEDLARTCHAHPTYSEAVREAALACGDGPIHS